MEMVANEHGGQALNKSWSRRVSQPTLRYKKDAMVEVQRPSSNCGEDTTFEGAFPGGSRQMATGANQKELRPHAASSKRFRAVRVYG